MFWWTILGVAFVLCTLCFAGVFKKENWKSLDDN
jgi:hypothetical protein